MELLVKALGGLVISRTRLALAFLLPLLVFAGLGIPKIGFQAGLRSIFDSENQIFADYIAHNDAFAQNETDILLLVTSEDKLQAATLSHLRDFVLDAQFVDGVASVQSIFSLRTWSQKTGFSTVLPFDLTNAQTVNTALQKAHSIRLLGLVPISKDLRKTMILVSLNPQGSDPSITLANLRDLADRFQTSKKLKIEMTGLLVARDELIGNLKTDQLKINMLGAIFGFIISAVLFRNVFIAALNAIVPVSALVMVLGLFGWVGFSINALTNALPVLILVLAGSDSIHMTFELRRRLHLGETAEQAIRQTLAHMVPPVVLTSITTILAFASLFTSDSPIVRELAFTGCAGVFVAMNVVLLVHPLVFWLVARRSEILAALSGLKTSKVPVIHTSPSKWKSATIAFGGLVLTASCFLILLPIQPSYRFLENIDDGSEMRLVMAEIEEFAGPFSTIELPFSMKDGVVLSDVALENDLTLITNELGMVSGVNAVASVLDLKRVTGEWENIPKLLAEIPEQLRSKFVSADNSRLVVTLRVEDLKSSYIQQIAQAAQGAVAAIPLSAVTAENPTGFVLVSAILSDQMILQLAESFLLAALICPLVIGLWYRRFDFALVAILPNVLPIALVAAMLTLIDLDIQLTAVLAMTIAFGIALDDSIHVFNRIHLQKSDGITAAIRTVRPVLITTTLVLSSGLAATQFSVMPTVQFFGVLCVAVFVFALICDLILLPALLRLVESQASR